MARRGICDQARGPYSRAEGVSGFEAAFTRPPHPRIVTRGLEIPVEAAVGLADKGSRATGAPLDDVKRDVGKVLLGEAGHGESLESTRGSI